MCLLTFLPAGTFPDPECLHNGATFNDDGHGYAIVDPERARILTGRGMDAREMIDEFVVVRDLYPDGPAMFHSRFATDGSVNLLNVHPFPVGGDSRTVLAHNGVMSIRPGAKDPRSDTRIVAEDYIPKVYGTLRRRRARLAFERWLTPYNKVVILTVDRRFRESAFILNERSGTWFNGIWYSNDGYLPYGGYGGYTSKPWVLGSVVESPSRATKCWVCDLRTSHYLTECPRCGVCFDCGEMPDHCLCYTPSKAIDGPERADPEPAALASFLAELDRDE